MLLILLGKKLVLYVCTSKVDFIDSGTARMVL